MWLWAPLLNDADILLPEKILMSASSNIAAGGTTATTAQLTAPSGKTSGADFQAGKISDDTNPLPSLDLASGKYTELEWCITALAAASVGETYQFRVVKADALGTPLDTYTVTPDWTIGSGVAVFLDWLFQTPSPVVVKPEAVAY